MRHVLAIFVLLFVYVVALAQGVSPAPSPAALPVVDSLSKWLMDHMAMAVVALGILIEIVVRAVPTAKPQSLLLWLSSALNSVVKLLQTLSEYADKLLQKTKG